MSRLICEGTRKDGLPCRAPALPASALCWAHDPRQAETAVAARRAGASKGGRMRALRGQLPRLDTAGALVRFNAALVHRLLAAELEVDVVRTLVYALTLQRALIETGDLSKRLEALEAHLATAATQKRVGRQW